MSTKRVLIVDDDPALVQALTRRIESVGIQVTAASDGMAAMLEIVRDAPDLVVLDVNMPTGDGLSLCAALAENTTMKPIPVVILTGRSDTETIDRCEQLGAHYVLKSANVWEDLQPLLRKLLELQPADPHAPAPATTPPTATANETEQAATGPTVLIIDDDPDVSKALKLRLRQYGIEVLRAFNGMQGYWTALKSLPDVVICDFNMPEGCGNYVLGRLKDHSLTRNIPVVFITGRTIDGRRDFGLERDLISLGAVKFMTKPVDFNELLSTLRRFIDIPQRSPQKTLLPAGNVERTPRL